MPPFSSLASLELRIFRRSFRKALKKDKVHRQAAKGTYIQHAEQLRSEGKVGDGQI